MNIMSKFMVFKDTCFDISKTLPVYHCERVYQLPLLVSMAVARTSHLYQPGMLDQLHWICLDFAANKDRNEKFIPQALKKKNTGIHYNLKEEFEFGEKQLYEHLSNLRRDD